MSQDERNPRVLAALVLSCNTRAIDSAKFTDAVVKLTNGKAGVNIFKGALEQCAAFDPAAMPSVVKAVAASAAYGVDEGALETLLTYLEVDEAVHFRLSSDYLDLLTVSELDSLADELKLKRAMGEGYKKARAGKKADFVESLLTIKGFEYAGLVPKAMRYTRRKLKVIADGGRPGADSGGEHGGTTAPSSDPSLACTT